MDTKTRTIDITGRTPVNVHLCEAPPMRVLVSQTLVAIAGVTGGSVVGLALLTAGHEGYALIVFVLGLMAMHTKYDGKTGGYET